MPYGMPRPVTRAVALHDDPNSRQHAIDAAAKKQRDKTTWEPRPAEKHDRIVVEHFAYPTKGYCFQLSAAGSARVVDGPTYTDHVTALSDQLKHYKRYRSRDGKKRLDYNDHPNGGVWSHMQSIAPWMVPSVSRIGKSEQEDLFLRIAEACDKKLKANDAGELEGGGVHLDVDSHPHFSLHIRRTRRNGFGFGKKNFYFSRWNAPAYRVNTAFPGLLDDYKVAMMEENFAKVASKGVKLSQYIDIELDKTVDETIEAWIKERGPSAWNQYQQDRNRYCEIKQAAEKRERSKTITKGDLDAFGLFLQDGKWRLSRFAIRKFVRLLPPNLQRSALVAIRAARNPLDIDPVQTMKAIDQLSKPIPGAERLLEIAAHGLPKYPR